VFTAKHCEYRRGLWAVSHRGVEGDHTIVLRPYSHGRPERAVKRQGKKTEARQILAEMYGWFTEGFDTKDLQEAKALLEELT
jgi:hypothetical protein